MDKPDPASMDNLEKALKEETQKAAEASAKTELDEAKDKLLRLAADFENFRKRSAKEQERAYASGVESAVFPVLKIFDVFDLAVKASAKSEDVKSIRKGLDMVMAEFVRSIGELGIERLEDASGKDFDPALHDAVMRSGSELVAEGKVISQISGGYKFSGRVIKAAQVVVSSGPEPKK